MAKFVPRDRKKRRKDVRKSREQGTVDTNVVEVMPVAAAEKETRRKLLLEELRARQPVISSKKAKRLDKYIDKKLHKEDTLALIKKLEANNADRSTLPCVEKQLRSSRKVRATPTDVDATDTEDPESSEASEEENSRTKSSVDTSKSLILGSGLKRKLDEATGGVPEIPKRQRSNKSHQCVEDSESPWEGIVSEADTDASGDSQLSASQSTGTQTDPEMDDDSSETSSFAESIEGIPNPEVEASKARRKERSSAFKAWASEQINEALGFTPSAGNASTHVGGTQAERIKLQPRKPEEDPLPPELQSNSAAPDRKAFSVRINRSDEIQEARLQLPIVAEEQKIMEAIYNNPTVIVWGATGSGKTTQVPQFLYEAGFGDSSSPNPGMIGITQPRRVAAVSMAKRVSSELGGASGKVSYQIRFESSVSDKTAVKFMTDGILIREIANDFALSKYSVIVIDEAHERSTNTDILIGMVSRIVDLRAHMSQEDPKTKPLKLVIMSATLRISDFLDNSRLFRNGPPPLLQAEGRQYPVTNHFSRRTQRDYLEEAFRKVSKGHRKLPPGGMLVFLTGQAEISTLSQRLKEAFVHSSRDQDHNARVRMRATDAPIETEDMDIGDEDQNGDRIVDESEDENTDPEEDDGDFDIGGPTTSSSSIHVLPLYSQLQTKDQLKVFEPPPEGSRLVVLATNVAETSLTIPGIRYVFDCGRAKEKKYDQQTGVQSFEIGWISKASASQRAGRAGRTGPGHCYRLYSSAVFERDFQEHSEPEILRMPVEDVVLQLKSMDLQHVVNFPFPTPPDRSSLAKAEKLLTYLGALSNNGKITPVGRDLSTYPLSPRFSKMLLIGHQHECMPYTIAMLAALAISDLFVLENQIGLGSSLASNITQVYSHAEQKADLQREQTRKDYNSAHHLLSRNSASSDAIKAMTALCAYAHSTDQSAFCSRMFLRPKAMMEASRLRAQLHSIVQNNRPGTVGTYNPRLPEIKKLQAKALQQIVAAAFIDQIAIRADLSPSPPEMARQPNRAIDVPYLPLFPIHQGRAKDVVETMVYVHPSSVLAHVPPKELPQYIIYARLQRGTAATVEASGHAKTRMHALTNITSNQITALAKGTPLLEYGKPIGKIVESQEGQRECWVGVEMRGEKGRAGWPLGAKRVVQRRKGGEWMIEKVLD